MASVFFELSDGDVQRVLGEVSQRVEDLTPAMQDVGESLLLSTRQRFDSGTDPEGRKWTPLSVKYAASKAKKKNALKGILTLKGFLRDTIVYDAGQGGFIQGNERPDAVDSPKL